MSIKSSVDKIVNLVYQLGTALIFEPIREFSKIWMMTYTVNKLKAVIILFTVFFIVSISCFLSYKIFIERNFGTDIDSKVELYSPNSGINNINSGGVGGVINGNQSTAEDGKERALDMYLQSYTGFFAYIGDFFEDYISNTADPLGHATTDSSGINFEPVVNKNSKIRFTSGNDVFYSAYRYASILIGIVAPILVLMVVITGLQVLMSQNNQYSFEKLTQKLTRICVTVALIFVGMPLLLTSSVMTTNLFNRMILSSGGATCPVAVGPTPSTKKDLKCFIKTITDNIRKEYIVKTDNKPDEVKIDGWDIGSMISVNTQNFWGFLQIVPIVILTMIMLILLFIVFIQFVLRYLQIYFLFAIYPIVAVMWYNQSTAKYFSEYWKQLVTLLIQQPVFLFCFVIFGDITLNLIQGFNPANILLFTIYLVFLTTVPQALTARIFGDVFAYQSGQDFSDKVNYIGNSAKSGFNNLKQSGANMASSGIALGSKAASSGIKNMAWYTPGAIKSTVSGTAKAISNPKAAIQSFPSSIAMVGEKISQTAKSGANSVMDKAEKTMTGKIQAPRSKEGFLNSQSDLQNEKDWNRYSNETKGGSNSTKPSSRKSTKPYSNVKFADSDIANGDSYSSVKNSTSNSSITDINSSAKSTSNNSNSTNTTLPNYSNTKYTQPTTSKPIPTDRQKSYEAAVKKRQQKLGNG